MIRILAFLGVLLWGQSALAACATPSGNGLVLSFVDAKFTLQSQVSANEGHLIYDAATKTMKLCNGNDWVKLLSSAGGAGTTVTTGKITANLGFATTHMRLGMYRYASTGSGGATRQWLHLKTNLPMVSRMIMLEFKGYEYHGAKPINARIGFYPYLASNDVVYVGKQGTHNLNVYKSSDGFSVVAIEAFEYYIGFIVNQYGANPQGLYPLVFTDTKWTTSNVGAY